MQQNREGKNNPHICRLDFYKTCRGTSVEKEQFFHAMVLEQSESHSQKIRLDLYLMPSTELTKKSSQVTMQLVSHKCGFKELVPPDGSRMPGGVGWVLDCEKTTVHLLPWPSPASFTPQIIVSESTPSNPPALKYQNFRVCFPKNPAAIGDWERPYQTTEVRSQVFVLICRAGFNGPTTTAD